MKKLELTGFIQGRVDAIQEVYRFDPSHGWQQTLAHATISGDPSHDHSRAYGEFAAFQDIVERFELPVNLDPPQLPEAKAAFQEATRLLVNETSDSELRRLGYSREG